MKKFCLILLITALLLSSCGREPTPTETLNPPPADTPFPQETVYPPPAETPVPVQPGTAYPPPGETALPPSPGVPPGDQESTAYPPPAGTEVPTGESQSTAYPPPGELPTLTQPPSGAETPYPPPGENPTPTSPAGTSGPTQYPGPEETQPPAPTRGLTPARGRTPGPTPTFDFEVTITETLTPGLTATARPISTAMPPPGTIAQTIRIWHSWSAGEAQVLDFVLQTFQDFYPDVAFDVMYVPQDELLGRYEMAAYRRSGPSLMFGPAEWGPLLYPKGLISDLSADADPQFLAEVNPAALGALRYQDALLGLPHRIRDGVLLYRNRSILPERPATLDQMIEMARAATRGGKVGCYLEHSFFFSAAHLIGLGGRLMDDQGRPAFNNRQGVAWLRLLQDFEQAGAADFNSDRDLDLFKQGRVGLVIAGSWNREELAEAIGEENLVIDPWPSAGGGHLSGFVRADGIYLNADLRGDERYAALLFMGFMLAREVQSVLARIDHIPAVLDVNVESAWMRQAMQAFEGATAYPAGPALQAYWDPLDAAIQAVCESNADPQAALQAAYDDILEKLK